jgi:hypothetical protein
MSLNLANIAKVAVIVVGTLYLLEMTGLGAKLGV